MKRLILILSFVSIHCISFAQEDRIVNNVGFGVQLNQIQDDFGIGFNAITPFLANEVVAVRVKTNLMWHQHISNGETVWSSYANLLTGTVINVGEINQSIRLYGESGLIFLFPSDEFSSDNMVIGGYGLFGFEFYFHTGLNYYIEIGGVGSGAKADLMQNSPIYSNGLLVSTGFRFHL